MCSGGDDQVPQRRLHQVPALHPARQHERVLQAAPEVQCREDCTVFEGLFLNWKCLKIFTHELTFFASFLPFLHISQWKKYFSTPKNSFLAPKRSWRFFTFSHQNIMIITHQIVFNLHQLLHQLLFQNIHFFAPKL